MAKGERMTIDNELIDRVRSVGVELGRCDYLFQKRFVRIEFSGGWLAA